MSEFEEQMLAEFKNIRRELTTIRQETLKIINYIADAESEVPERYRRFVNAFHDIHDIRYMYHEEGQACPDWLDREIERMHDRYRQILKDMNAEGGVFNKVRRAMASDSENRYDHTRLLAKPNGAESETGSS